MIKGWTLTLVLGLLAFDVFLFRDVLLGLYIIFAFVMVAAFALLDFVTLQGSRQYEALYRRVRQLPEDCVDFSMDTKPFVDQVKFRRGLIEREGSVWVFATFYIMTAILLFIGSQLMILESEALI